MSVGWSLLDRPQLFYVALTRARREAVLFTTAAQESPFVVELVQEGKVFVDGDGAPDVEVCPACAQGTTVIRSGPYGKFLGCSTFPRCRFTKKVVTETKPAPASSAASWMP